MKVIKRFFYTDGSSKGNPGPGGFGVVELTEDQKEIFSYHQEISENTTNNREELKAILWVVEKASKNSEDEFIIYSDSAYCVNTINNWMWGWAKNNWLNSKKKPAENLDLIKPLYKFFNIPFFNVEVKKITGHHGEIGNELADRLATNNIKSFQDLIQSNSISLINPLQRFAMDF